MKQQQQQQLGPQHTRPPGTLGPPNTLEPNTPDPKHTKSPDTLSNLSN